MPAFTLTGFAVLRAVAEHGTFTAAAEALGYAQSAISRQVAAMEDAAGAPLFERGRRGVRLTAAGARLLTHANAALDHVDAATREMTSLAATTRGRLRVGAFPTAVAALVPRALTRHASEEPLVEILLREGTTPTQLRRLRAGALDLAVLGSPLGGELDAPDLTLTRLLDDPMLLAVARSHPFASRRTVEVVEFAGERWISGSTNTADALLGAWPRLDWKPDVAYVVRDWTAKLGLVAEGLGIAVVPALAAVAVRSDVALVKVRAEPPVSRTVAVALPASRERPPLVAGFIDQLERVAAALRVEIDERLGPS
ncbi:MAG TPA: LysR family transcriptional regulator [Thermoleophilaceae bacterium]|jgi:DNA-binding transcriptional LysR family regulator